MKTFCALSSSLLIAALAAAAEPTDQSWCTLPLITDGNQLSTFDATAKLPPRKRWAEPIRDIKRPATGYIGLQNHDPGDVVWFKEVSARLLDDKPAQPAKKKVIDKQKARRRDGLKLRVGFEV